MRDCGERTGTNGVNRTKLSRKMMMQVVVMVSFAPTKSLMVIGASSISQSQAAFEWRSGSG